MHPLLGAIPWYGLTYRWRASESHLQPSVFRVDLSQGLIIPVHAPIVAPTCHLIL